MRRRLRALAGRLGGGTAPAEPVPLDSPDPVAWAAAYGPPVVVRVWGEGERVDVPLPPRARLGGSAGEGEDLALLAAGVAPEPGWLDALQHSAHVMAGEGVGLASARVVAADARLESAGLQLVSTATSPAATPAPADTRRFAGAPADHPPAGVMQTVLGADPACALVTPAGRAALGEADLLSDPLGAALAVWAAGRRVIHAPGAVARRRGPSPPAPPAPVAAPRTVAHPDGGLHIVYVTQDTGMGGGHRVVFHHLDGLRARGHHTELWTLDPAGPDWFDLATPVRRFADYPSLMRALTPLDALKVATWWETAAWVWEAGVTRGLPVFLVQDIETSYYAPEDPERHRVLAAYRPEFRYLATSGWVAAELAGLRPGGPPAPAPPGIEDERLVAPAIPPDRHPAAVVALARSNPLKNFPLTREAYRALPDPRPELWLFGSEPELADGLGDAVTFHDRPSDEEVAALYARATVFVQTSAHEGYCLPILEAMAAGTPVVCTDAHGNRDFCVDGDNCLMPGADPTAVADAIARLLADPALRERLSTAGRATAEEHRWSRWLDALDVTIRALR